MPDERLSRLADELIPGRNGLPSASEADPAGKWLERALAARPDLVPAYERALGAPNAKALEASDPEAFEALTTIAAGAYTMNVKVRRRIGYPGQKPSPPFPDEADYYIEGLLPELPPAPEPVAQEAPAPAVSPEGVNVLVIGAGASGAVVAKHMAEAGFSVLCLEQGGWQNPSDYAGDRQEFELLVEHAWSPDPNVRAP
jgi:hypothetical protein